MRCGPDLAVHIENVVLHQDNAACHITRSTLLEIDVLGFKRGIHEPYSTDLAPLDCVYFHNLKSYLRANDIFIELKSVIRYKNATDHQTVPC